MKKSRRVRTRRQLLRATALIAASIPFLALAKKTASANSHGVDNAIGWLLADNQIQLDRVLSPNTDPRVTLLLRLKGYSGQADDDQVLVGVNRTRRAYNQRMRDLKGFSEPLPVAGDRLSQWRRTSKLAAPKPSMTSSAGPRPASPLPEPTSAA